MKWLVDEYIGYYNHDRPHSFNDYLSPVKFEKVRLDQIIEIENADLEDDQDFEAGAFNRKVIADIFNEVICEQLAKELDPFGDEKALIFCATDLHADMVK